MNFETANSNNLILTIFHGISIINPNTTFMIAYFSKLLFPYYYHLLSPSSILFHLLPIRNYQLCFCKLIFKTSSVSISVLKDSKNKQDDYLLVLCYH